ncbi:MAG: hypothetical protein HZA24_02690 [Nitrospirae bacterium]|nr:hypothetical protein [Nitrospirota bacterium]
MIRLPARPRLLIWSALALAVLALTLLRSAGLRDYSTWIIDEERIVTTALGFLGGDLNPRWFNYHTLPMYILAAWYTAQYAVYSVLGLVASKTEFVAFLYGADAHVYVSAKLCFSLAYSLGCLVLALMAHRRTGSLAVAALCLLLPVLLPDGQAAAVQVRNDTFVFLFLALTAYFACFAQPRPRNAYLAVACAAAAFASKIPAIVLLPVLTAWLALQAWRGRLAWRHVALALALFPLFVFLFMPYMVLDFEAYRPTIERAAGRASGTLLHVGKDYHSGLTEKLSSLLAATLKQVGAPVLVGALGTALYGAWRDRRLLFAFLFGLAYVTAFATSVTLDDYWLRPVFPLFVCLALLLPWLLVADPAVGGRLPAPWRAPGVALLAGLLLTAPLWHGARPFLRSVAAQPPDTRVVAARWIEDNLPAGAPVVLEGWLPHYLPRLFTPDPATELAVQNYLIPTVTANRTLMEAFAWYMWGAVGVTKPFRVRVLSQTVQTGYDPRALRLNAGDYVVISELIYKRFYQENLARQAPQLTANARRFYAMVRAQEPVREFAGQGPRIEIYRMRQGWWGAPPPR